MFDLELKTKILMETQEKEWQEKAKKGWKKYGEKDEDASQGQERSAEALWRGLHALLPLPAPSVLLDIAQRSEALQQRRVGVMPHREQPISHRET